MPRERSPNSRPGRSRSVRALPRYRYVKRRYRFAARCIDLVGSAAASLFAGWRSPRPQLASTEPRRILLVQLDHLGDAVLSTPLIAALARRFPAAEVDVLASTANREIFAADPRVHHVHVSERNWHTRGRRSFAPAVLRIGRILRPFRYDWAIDPRGDLLVLAALWVAGIPRRVSWACGGGGFFLTDVLDWDGRRHEVDARLEIARYLGATADRQPEVFPSWADTYAVREWLGSVAAMHPIVVVHASAGTAAKRWPNAYFAELLSELADYHGASIVLVGDARDRRRCPELGRVHPRVIDARGLLSIMQFAALVQESTLFIGCDSGPAHIAAAVGTPTLVLFSAANRSSCWRPIGPHVHIVSRSVPCAPCHQPVCPLADHACMNQIRPRDVLQLVRAIGIERTRSKSVRVAV